MAKKIRILKTGRTMTVAESQARGLVNAGIAEVVVEASPVEVQPASPAADTSSTTNSEATRDEAPADVKKRKYQRRDMTAKD